MDLLSFARGPALKVAITIFCLGAAWRVVAFALLRIRRDLNKPRASVFKYMTGGLVAVASRSWPHREFIGRTGAGEALGYSYHIGLFALVLLFARQPRRRYLAGTAQQPHHHHIRRDADLVSRRVVPAGYQPCDADAVEFRRLF